MTEAELIIQVTRELRSLATNFDSDDFADAVDASERDTGFVFPATDSFQIKWLINRTKRHLLFALVVDSSVKFKFKQINLQQKFEQLKKLVDSMDKEFEVALADNVYEFAQVDPVHMFGHKADAGFAYDSFGNDITFDEDQKVFIAPNDSSS
jgi:hypothetical protein